MNTFNQLFKIICLSIFAVGCVIDAPAIPEEVDPPGNQCGLNAEVCAGNEVCAVIDPCGSACEGGDPRSACPDVCVEILGCVAAIEENEPCFTQQDHCGDDLRCQYAGSGPSFCDGDICTQDYVDIFTCQPNRCDPNSDENTCTNGDVCGITHFEEDTCLPDGPCADVEPAPYFGCVTPLAQDEICTRQHTYSGFDQCGEGLVCTYGQAPCEEICDESGACELNCGRTPASTCQPKPIVTCDPKSDENTCTDGDVCDIVGFEDTCTPEGYCLDIEPDPIFGCVPALSAGDVCNQDGNSSFGIDRCGEDLVCSPSSDGCEPSCDENGFCTSECGSTLFICQ